MFQILVNTTLSFNERVERQREIALGETEVAFLSDFDCESASSELLEHPNMLAGLIGRHMVRSLERLNEGTLKAFADHGEIGPLLPADGGDCEAVLAKFANAGVDIDALAARLQDAGVASFVKSWNALIEVIESKTTVALRAGQERNGTSAWTDSSHKVLARRILPELDTKTEPKLGHDSSTNAMIYRYRKLKDESLA